MLSVKFSILQLLETIVVQLSIVYFVNVSVVVTAFSFFLIVELLVIFVWLGKYFCQSTKKK